MESQVYFKEIRQYPKVIVQDDGSKFRSREFEKVTKEYRMEEMVIPPGKPFKNRYVESFHSRLREELLSAEVFESVEDSERKVIEWVRWYNSKDLTLSPII